MLEKTEPGKVKERGGFSLLDMKHFVEERGHDGDAYQYLSLEDLKLLHAPIECNRNILADVYICRYHQGLAGLLLFHITGVPLLTAKPLPQRSS
jgi:hypothetical protein